MKDRFENDLLDPELLSNKTAKGKKWKWKKMEEQIDESNLKVANVLSLENKKEHFLEL